MSSEERNRLVSEYLTKTIYGYLAEEGEDGSRVACVVWFLEVGMLDSGQNGREVVGYSFRRSYRTWRLVVKSVTEQTQDVVFITERTPMDCVWVYLAQALEGRLNWVPDRYA